mmetsp:Transcript_63224/g.150794  ORF Transcript_63224/g.150794 Transcript_63224/m.150794 type:complete len:610 (-) Transcript_63224:85-1914(-)
MGSHISFSGQQGAVKAGRLARRLAPKSRSSALLIAGVCVLSAASMCSSCSSSRLAFQAARSSASGGLRTSRWASTSFRESTRPQQRLTRRAAVATKAEAKQEQKQVEDGPEMSIDQHRQMRLEKLEAMREAGIEPFAYAYPVTHNASTLQTQYESLPDGGKDPAAEVAVAGRIMAKRTMGKLAFLKLQDHTGSVQICFESKRLGEKFKAALDFINPGDIVGAHGSMLKTKKGELSVLAEDWEMLSKALLPLPDKYHGLTDKETRYRQRHLDMIANPAVAATFRARAKLTSSLRRRLDERDYLEIETPVLHDQAGGAAAKPFTTYYNALKQPMTLRIATELHLKRLIIGGIDRVYELGRIFRNEGLSLRHNPEFTSVELYEAYADYNTMMDLAEDLISGLAVELLGTTDVSYGSDTLDLSPPWRRVSMYDLVREETDIDFEHADMSLEEAKAAAIAAGVREAALANLTSVGEVATEVFEERCEANLLQPTFVCDLPIEVSPLAKQHRSKPGLTERFELYIAGRELANAYSELNDPIEQRKRFEAQAAKRALGDEEACGVDEDFILAMEQGMPPTAGMGIGVDRLAMLLTDSPSIRDVIAFPQMRREVQEE